MHVYFGPYPDDNTEREIKITVDGFDTWNLDHTMSMIIVACLEKYMEHLTGGPFISNDDVPPQLHRPADAEDWQSDEHWFARWKWVLDEMLFAFKQGTLDDDYTIPPDQQKAIDERANNGRRLFAKYFHGLWN